MLRKLEIEDAKCLIMWPDHTRDYDQELAAITYLLMIANAIGYGRLSQLAAQIEELWRNPSLWAEFEQSRQEFVKMMTAFAQSGDQ